MKESIHIKNFGPLKDIDIEEIKPMTVFIGESASGKSTLMKVVVLMRYLYKMVNIRSYLKNANITKSPFKLRFDTLLHDGLENMLAADTQITYTVSINGNTYTIAYKDKALKANINIPNADLVFFKESYISETRSIIPTWASKVAAIKGADLGFFFHETFSDFNEATDVVKDQNLDYLGLKLKIQKSGNKPKRFMIEAVDGNYDPIELRYASSGIQTSAPLVTIVRYFANEFSFKDAFQRSVLSYLYEQDLLSMFNPGINQNDLDKYVHIHIEEAELSLDPEAQRALVNDIVGEAFHRNGKDRTLGLMIATHSPYITNHLNVLLRAGYFEKSRKDYPYLRQEDIAVYKLQEGVLTSLMATDNESGEYVINTYDLSDTMERIYDEYESIAETEEI